MDRYAQLPQNFKERRKELHQIFVPGHSKWHRVANAERPLPGKVLNKVNGGKIRITNGQGLTIGGWLKKYLEKVMVS